MTKLQKTEHEGAEPLDTVLCISVAIAGKPLENETDSSHQAPEPILLVVVRNDQDPEAARRRLKETIQSCPAYRNLAWTIDELDVEHLLERCRAYAADPHARYVVRDTILAVGAQHTGLSAALGEILEETKNN